jgi:hypothetical protein
VQEGRVPDLPPRDSLDPSMGQLMTAPVTPTLLNSCGKSQHSRQHRGRCVMRVLTSACVMLSLRHHVSGRAALNLLADCTGL